MKPIVATGRVVGLDVARCLALIAMIATHILDSTGEHGITFTQQLAGGRAAALFAVLAGVSLALMSGGSNPVAGRERRAVSDGLAVRALVITVIGLVLGELGSGIAVILTYYGLLFVFGLPFLGLRARPLALLSAAWLTVVPVLSHLLRPHLPDRGFASPHFAALHDPWQLLSELTFTGYYPTVPWMAYLLAGMAIGRFDLSRWRAGAYVALLGSVLAAVSWSASRMFLEREGVLGALRRTYDGQSVSGSMREVLAQGLHGSTPTESWWWLAVAAPHSATPFDLAQTIGSALVVIGLCLVAGRLLPTTLAVVFGAGAMTLTLYAVHVFLRSPGLWDGDTTGTFFGHVVAALLVGAAFRVARRRGPVEAVVTELARRTSSVVRRSPAP